MKIAIASGKGGTGKTTLSVNLASFLAEQQEVVLADLDVEEPNSGLFIRADLIHEEDTYKMVPDWIEDSCTFCGECQKVCNFHAVIQLGEMIMVFPELCHACYACSELCPADALPMIPKKMGKLKHFRKHNLHFIESRLDIGEEQAVPLIKQTHQYISRQLNGNDILIYDAPPGSSCPVIEATKDADYVILVTEPTPFGLHDMKLAVETMKELKKEIGVVINRDGIGNNDVWEYCEKEQIPVLAKIPNDRRIAEMYAQGQLLYQEVPEFRLAITEISNQIMTLKEKCFS
jgi:MinD superfamily P-loop ATPase